MSIAFGPRRLWSAAASASTSSGRFRIVSQLTRVQPEVERRPREPEHVEVPPKRGQPAVGDHVSLRWREGSSRSGRARPAARRPSGSRRRRAAPRSPSAAVGTARSGCGRRAGRPRRRGGRPPPASSTCPMSAASARTSRRSSSRTSAEPRSTASRTVSAPAFGFPSRSPPIQVPNLSGSARQVLPPDGQEVGCGVPEAVLEEPERLPDLVHDARPVRANLVGLPEDRDLLCQRHLPFSPLGGREPGVVQPVEQLRDPRGASRGSSAGAPRWGAP